jgi:hypothetical protein
VAHLAVARAAVGHAGLSRVDLVVSESPLGKAPTIPVLSDRLAVLGEVASKLGWLGVRTTTAQLIADLADGYDVVIVGADKWSQICDVSWYGTETGRDRALERLPDVLIVPRPPFPLPEPTTRRVRVLPLDDTHAEVSSSGARRGRADWMLPEAAAFDQLTGAWSDPARYLHWHEHHRSGGAD